eukprot:1177076-Prorocentrum_minimum.AAC.2
MRKLLASSSSLVARPSSHTHAGTRLAVPAASAHPPLHQAVTIQQLATGESTIKPLLISELATGEFNSPPNSPCLPPAAERTGLKSLLISELATGELNPSSPADAFADYDVCCPCRALLTYILYAASVRRWSAPPLLGPHAAVKPLTSRFTTENFKSPP